MAGQSPLRIVVVAHSFVIPSVWARWERLAERHPNSDVTLVSPTRLRTRRFDVEQSFHVVRVDRGNFHVRPLPSTVRGMYRSVTVGFRRARPHVIEVNEEPTEWALLQTFLAARAFAPEAARFFYYYTNILSRPQRWHQRAKLSAVFRLADGAFAGSEDSEHVLRALGFSAPVWIQTEIGADERIWTPHDERRGDAPFTVGFVGALTPQKGVLDLAKAVLDLRGEWRLVVVGDGPEREAIRETFAAAGHAHRLELKGLVDRDDVPALMRGLDVLVLPSRTMPPFREQFGLVLAEAMLSGVAVIGSDSGAIPEVIGEDGLIFPEGDHRALASLLQRLADDPGFRSDLAGRGRARALRLYSATALADQTYELYRGLAREQGRR